MANYAPIEFVQLHFYSVVALTETMKVWLNFFLRLLVYQISIKNVLKKKSDLFIKLTNIYTSLNIIGAFNGKNSNTKSIALIDWHFRMTDLD